MHRISIIHLSLPTDIWIPDYATHNQRWEFIKENKKYAIRPRKRSGEKKKKESSLLTKKAIKKNQ